MSDPGHVLVCGRGGHASVVAASLLRGGWTVAGYVLREAGAGVDDPVLEILEDELTRERYGRFSLANGVGSVRPGGARRRVFESLRARGFRFATVVDPSAVLVGEITLEEGAQVLAGAVVQPGVIVGANTIVNTRAGIDHGCRIGAHAHLAPGCTLAGDVVVGDGAHIGAGAVVIEGVRIGEGAFVAAGATVIIDVAGETRVAGVPARPMD
jgi:UDP-perosamine 4-acetyltransferase